MLQGFRFAENFSNQQQNIEKTLCMELWDSRPIMHFFGYFGNEYKSEQRTNLLQFSYSNDDIQNKHMQTKRQ